MIKKTLITIIAVLTIAVLLLGSVYIENKSKNTSSNLQTYTTRKEELITKNQQLQTALIELNNTLNLDIAREQNLTKKLASLPGSSSQPSTSSSSGSTSPGSSSPSSSSSTPSTPTPQPPAPTPPTPVTRAS